MTKRKRISLTQQQAIDNCLILGLWLTLAWVAILRAPITAMGIASAFSITPLSLFIGIPLVLLLSFRIKKRHAAKDYLPTTVRQSLIAFMLCMVICTLSLTDSYDIGDPFSALTMYSGGVISVDTSHGISMLALVGAGFSPLVAATVGIAKSAERP